jgi:HSP20 family protein
MNIIRFNPFAEVTSLRDQVNRLFDEVASPRSEGREGASPRMWAPLVDITETENEVVVTLDVPGVERDGIDVQLSGESLVVRGERKFARREGTSYVHLERLQGAFSRSFTIGVPVQPDRVSASYRDGVLTVTLPKAEAVKPRKVQIQSDGDGSQPVETRAGA